MGVYDRQIATAQRLIREKGQSVTWRSVRDGAPGDSSQPWKPGAAVNTDNTVNMVFLPPDRRNSEFLRLLADTELPKGDVLGYMGAVSFTPSLKDIIIRGSETYTITSLDHLQPNEESILWIVGLKR